MKKSNSIRVLAIAFSLLIAGGAFAQIADSLRGTPEPTADPFNLDSTDSRGAYGPDDRQEATDAKGYEEFVRATAVMINKKKLKGNVVNCPTLRQNLSYRYGTDNFGDNVNFLDQAACSNCTGFLIAPDVLVTAGHCIEKMKDCNDYVWVFDYTKDLYHSKYSGNITLEKEDIFTCEDILSTTLVRNGGDYAVIKLNRKSNRSPYRFRVSGKIGMYEDVFMIGAPSGLPLKFADNAWVSDNDATHHFEANLDAFGGNSGGPVFDRAGWIEGILVRGASDYKYDQSCDCIKVAEHFNFASYGEDVQRITKLPFKILLSAIYDNLEYAIRKRDDDRLEKWLAYNGMLNHSYTAERGRLEYIAMEVGNTNALKMLLEKSGANDLVDEQGRNALYYAIKNGSNDMLEYLLGEGYNPNTTDNYGETPIYYAISAGKADMVKKLLERGAKLNLSDSYGETPLHKAVRSNDLSMVRLLVQNSSPLLTKNNRGWTACKLAKKLKNKPIKKYLKKAEKGKV